MLGGVDNRRLYHDFDPRLDGETEEIRWMMP